MRMAQLVARGAVTGRAVVRGTEPRRGFYRREGAAVVGAAVGGTQARQVAEDGRSRVSGSQDGAEWPGSIPGHGWCRLRGPLGHSTGRQVGGWIMDGRPWPLPQGRGRVGAVGLRRPGRARAVGLLGLDRAQGMPRLERTLSAPLRRRLSAPLLGLCPTLGRPRLNRLSIPPVPVLHRLSRAVPAPNTSVTTGLIRCLTRTRVISLEIGARAAPAPSPPPGRRASGRRPQRRPISSACA